MRPVILAWFGLVAALGCGQEPYQVAPVSGRVTLNGKPLPNAFVHFGPVGTQERNPGPTAQGKTDAEGRYTLRLDISDRAGAVVGQSRVYITTAVAAAQGPQPDAGGKRTKEVVPARYNQETTLTVEVRPGGTDQADFDLKAP
jgi:hypothetical protein